MKNFIMILLAVLIGGSYVVAAAVENDIFFPVIFDSSAEPTARPTPTHAPEPPPTPAPTPTPVYTGGGYTWVYVGIAEIVGNETWVAGLKPGYCYDVILDRIDDGGVAVLKSLEIEDGYWWCTAPPYNPDAPWPPPQYDVPDMPPDIFDGEIFKFKIDRRTKVVCGWGQQTNCYTVIRP